MIDRLLLGLALSVGAALPAGDRAGQTRTLSFNGIARAFGSPSAPVQRPEGPSADREICDLIPQMSTANSLGGAARILGELLKLGIEISQATVAKYMLRKRGAPSPLLAEFLTQSSRRHYSIDMFFLAASLGYFLL